MTRAGHERGGDQAGRHETTKWKTKNGKRLRRAARESWFAFHVVFLVYALRLTFSICHVSRADPLSTHGRSLRQASADAETDRGLSGVFQSPPVWPTLTSRWVNLFSGPVLPRVWFQTAGQPETAALHLCIETGFSLP
jgi:hypothetical protein